MSGSPVSGRALARLATTKRKLVRFTSHCRNSPCWVWAGDRNVVTGLPIRQMCGVTISARRWLYEMLLGPVPDSKVVGTYCGSADCCNPAHLKLTDRAEIARDASDLTDGDRESIIELATRIGRSHKAIARALDLPLVAVSSFLKRVSDGELGPMAKTSFVGCELTAEQREAIIAAGKEHGYRPSLISRLTGVGNQSVAAYLKRLPEGMIKDPSQMTFKPMKGDAYDPAKAVFPYIGSNKIDGLRCLIINGKAMTSSLKLHPNKFIQEFFADGRYDGLDGELTCGEPNLEETFRLSSTLRKSTGEPDFYFYVFDDFTNTDMPYDERCVAAQRKINANQGPGGSRVRWVDTFHVHNAEHVEYTTEEALKAGYEGIMLRHPTGRYKFGRSTTGENLLLKVKPWQDAECRIIGLVEQQTNNNAKTKDEMGRSKRSSSKSGKTNAGTLGAFKVVGINGQYKGVEFEIGSGTGLTHALRQKIWDDSKSYLGKVMTYRFQDLGGYDKPRIPQFKSFRPESEVE